MSLSRRELFGFLRPRGADAPATAPAVPAPAPAPAPTPTPTPPAFSLDGFYRDRGSPRALPTFEVRAATPVPTTRVGVGPAIAPAARPLAAPTPVPAGLVPTVLADACLASRTFCSVCVERCPRPGAIVVTAGRPRVVAEACDGCGRCVAVCPAPVLAFALIARPAPVTDPGAP